MRLSPQSWLFLLAGVLLGIGISQFGILMPLVQRRFTSLDKSLVELRQMVMKKGEASCCFRSSQKRDFPVQEVEDSVLSRAWQNVKEPRHMNGVDYNVPKILSWLKSCKAYNATFRSWPAQPKPANYGYVNDHFCYLSSAVYHCLIKQRRPPVVLEVGCGYSTFVARDAVKENGVGKVIAIDPEPRYSLDGAGGIEFIRTSVDNTSLSVFTSLQPGSIVFFDTWHTLNFFGDVRYFFVDVLPRIPKGVLVMIHDVHMPVAVQPVNRDSQWNEEFALNLFLMFNNNFEVRWPGRYMWSYHLKEMAESLGESDLKSSDASFWFERVH